MSWITNIVNVTFIMMSLYYVKNVLKWVDNVETVIEKHVIESRPVVSCKRWKMNTKKNQNRKKNGSVYINFHYIINFEFQYRHD